MSASAYPGQEFKAAVTSIAPTVDARSRTALVRLSPDDPDGKLRDGMFAQVQLQTGDGKASVLLVPKSAVAQEGQDSVVYVVSDGKLQRRVVKVGSGAGDQVGIAQGLSEGERVVASGLAGLKDGQIVTVQ